MAVILPVHVLAGGVALVSGFVALYSAKGARRHRRSGIVFVYAMLTMSLLGAVIAAFFRPNAGNVVAGLLTAYLVVTALTTVREPAAGSRGLALVLFVLALTLGLTSVTFGLGAAASPHGTRDGIPAGVFFMFGSVALLSSVGDLRMIRAGGLQGARRIARHLWRMCFALFIAAASFFLGQAKVIPKPVRIPGLLPLPVLAVLVTMVYWLWRVRARGVGSTGALPAQ